MRKMARYTIQNRRRNYKSISRNMLIDIPAYNLEFEAGAVSARVWTLNTVIVCLQSSTVWLFLI